MSNQIHYLFNNNVVVMTNGTDVREVRATDNPDLFQQLINLCLDGQVEDAYYALLDSNTSWFLNNRLAEITGGMLTVNPATDEVIFAADDGRKLPIVSEFAKRIREAWRRGDQKTLDVYKTFMIKASNNPNDISASDLFEFVSVNKLPLSDDGEVLAYKIVRPDFMDLHSNTKNHAPGMVVTEDNVDYDRDVTCSNGLHFCSKDYLPAYGGSFGSGNAANKIVLVKIHPSDVAAFPRDYNNAKGRCRKYTVVGELPTAFFTAIVNMMESVPFVKMEDLGAPAQVVDRVVPSLTAQADSFAAPVQNASGVTVFNSIPVVGSARWYVGVRADNQPDKIIEKFATRGAARNRRDELVNKIQSNLTDKGYYAGLLNPFVFVYDSWA